MDEKRDIRQGMAIGASMGLGLVTVKTVESSLKDRLGEWPAWGVGVLVAIVVALVVSNLVYRFVKPPA